MSTILNCLQDGSFLNDDFNCSSNQTPNPESTNPECISQKNLICSKSVFLFEIQNFHKKPKIIALLKKIKTATLHFP